MIKFIKFNTLTIGGRYMRSHTLKHNEGDMVFGSANLEKDDHRRMVLVTVYLTMQQDIRLLADEVKKHGIIDIEGTFGKTWNEVYIQSARLVHTDEHKGIVVFKADNFTVNYKCQHNGTPGMCPICRQIENERREAAKPKGDNTMKSIWVGDRYKTNRTKDDECVCDLRILNLFSVEKAHEESLELCNVKWISTERHQVTNGNRMTYVVYELYDSAVLSDACAWSVRVSELHDFLTQFEKWEPALVHRDKEHIPPEAAPQNIKMDDKKDPHGSIYGDKRKPSEDAKGAATVRDDGFGEMLVRYTIHGIRPEYPIGPGMPKIENYKDEKERETYPTDEDIRAVMIRENLTSAWVEKRYRMPRPDIQKMIAAKMHELGYVGKKPTTIGLSPLAHRYLKDALGKVFSITTYEGLRVYELANAEGIKVVVG